MRERPVLLTGASGALGRMLASGLAPSIGSLRLTDIAPFPDTLSDGVVFEQADLLDTTAIRTIAQGCGTILHFGGTSTDKPFEAVEGPNLRALHTIYEVAREERARVVFASSNHAIGFHPRTATLEANTPYRADSFYGLSKAFGELMGRLYWDKHGVENVNIRIGSCFPEPKDARMLATWLSYEDLIRLVRCCVQADRVGHAMIWGASANTRMTWWGGDDRARVGWSPLDSADPWTSSLLGKVSGDQVAEHHQGGAYCAQGYSRAVAPSD